MSDHEQQRFVDRHGLWRNRRALVVSKAGLTIEHWLGAPTLIPWRRITRARWQGSDQLMVVTPTGELHFGRSVAGLERLAQALEVGLTSGPDDAEPLAVTTSEVMARLNGQTSFVVPAVGGNVVLLALHWLVALLVCLTVAVASVLPSAGLIKLWPVLAFGGLALLGIVALLRVIRRLARARGTATVDIEGVRIAYPKGTVSFQWHEVRDVSMAQGRVVVHLTDRTFIELPNAASLDGLYSALSLVSSARRRMPSLKQPVSSAALSRIGPTMAEADRGLSPAEEVDA